MVSDWREYIENIAKEFPGTLSSNAADQNESAHTIIFEPIDKGAKKLLDKYSKSWLEYPALEVEYLIKTLNDHLANCINLREKAQELEVRAIQEVIETSGQIKTLEISKNLLDKLILIEPLKAANSIDASVLDKDKQKQYWDRFFELNRDQIDSQLHYAQMRLENFKENGSGRNYIERFVAIKKLFEVELIEAYLRAQAASKGLAHVYGITKAVPALIDIGYLDTLLIWAREATYELEKKLFKYSEATLAFSLNGNSSDLPTIMTSDAFKKARDANLYSFKITKETFNRLEMDIKNPRMRGINLIAIIGKTGNSNDQNYWRVRVDIPEQTIQSDTGAAWNQRPRVLLPLVTYPMIDQPSPETLSQRSVMNATPFGEWLIKTEPQEFRAGLPNSEETLTNLVLKIRVSYER
jgi:hypothetical protein